MSDLDIIRELNRVKAEFQLRSIATIMGLPAQGGEAGTAETHNSGSVHEHPVVADDALTRIDSLLADKEQG